jgi:ABC-type amino acid transport substrate-binding protein
MPIARAIALAALWIVTLAPGHSVAQVRAEAQPLLVGVTEGPPYAIKKPDGSWVGLGVDLWRVIAAELDLEYELREYPSLESLVRAVEAGEVDATPTLAASMQKEVALDLSHSYYASGSAIAVAARLAEPRWLALLEKLVSWAFLRVIGALVLVWLTAGAIVWLFERGDSRQMFGGGALKGLGNGIWWAAVTMTTVGYGDKAPRTLGGRTVAMVWMLASIILISSFTAAITTSLTVDELGGRIRGLRDLPRVRVGAVTASEALRFLDEQGIRARRFATAEDGLLAIVDDEIDALVFDEMVLRYRVRGEFPEQLRVLPSTFDRYHMKFALPAGSSLREPLNRALLKAVEEGEWSRLEERYIGSER